MPEHHLHKPTSSANMASNVVIIAESRDLPFIRTVIDHSLVTSLLRVPNGHAVVRVVCREDIHGEVSSVHPTVTHYQVSGGVGPDLVVHDLLRDIYGEIVSDDPRTYPVTTVFSSDEPWAQCVADLLRNDLLRRGVCVSFVYIPKRGLT